MTPEWIIPVGSHNKWGAMCVAQTLPPTIDALPTYCEEVAKTYTIYFSDGVSLKGAYLCSQHCQQFNVNIFIQGAYVNTTSTTYKAVPFSSTSSPKFKADVPFPPTFKVAPEIKPTAPLVKPSPWVTANKWSDEGYYYDSYKDPELQKNLASFIAEEEKYKKAKELYKELYGYNGSLKQAPWPYGAHDDMVFTKAPEKYPKAPEKYPVPTQTLAEKFADIAEKSSPNKYGTTSAGPLFMYDASLEGGHWSYTNTPVKNSPSYAPPTTAKLDMPWDDPKYDYTVGGKELTYTDKYLKYMHHDYYDDLV